jgi:hypothetical protein
MKACVAAMAFAFIFTLPAGAEPPGSLLTTPPNAEEPARVVPSGAATDRSISPARYFAGESEWSLAGHDTALELRKSPTMVMGPLEIVHESLCGPASQEDWKPLELSTFFSEGWDRPFVNAPAGTNDAPKQNWIGAPAGIFGRFATLDFFYTNHLNNVSGLFLTSNAPFMPVHTSTTGNQYAGYATVLLPLNSRVELMMGTVFIDSRKSSSDGGYVGNWGDIGVQARFHLIEQRNFSLVGVIGERIPTGKSVNGSGINFVSPGLEFWWNFAPRWVARGGTSINILTGRKTATSVYVNQLSVGRYLTSKDAIYLKELEVHMTTTVLSDVAGGKGFVDDIYLFPGLRFGLDKDHKWYILGGVQVPVSGPQPYGWQPQCSVTRIY